MFPSAEGHPRVKLKDNLARTRSIILPGRLNYQSFAYPLSIKDVLSVNQGWKQAGDSLEIWLFIGPEGGWSETEAGQAGALGIVALSLGPRILRTETAGIVAASVILYESGDLG